MFDVEGHAVNCGRVSVVIEFHDQLGARFTKIAQGKSERNDLIELRGMDGTADPAHFTIATVKFGSMRRNH
jgi:hypothetical protein